jgi:hypothetical protein
MVQLLRFRDIICIGERESMGTPTASSYYIFFSHSFIDEKHTMIVLRMFFLDFLMGQPYEHLQEQEDMDSALQESVHV